MYTYGSLFTGIGGIDLGLEKAGFECQWMVENDPTCVRVMEHHWPKVPKFGDVTKVKGKDLEEVDLIVGGWPCQDLSVAGLRGGLAGQRSGLFFEFTRLVDELSPSWVLAENVPGLLSAGCKPACPGGCVKSHGGAMGTVIGALADRGYGYAWRVLDAQYFGLAQRRKRVFLVGHLGEPWSAPAEVLLERDSLCGDPPARPAKKQDAATRVEGSPRSSDLIVPEVSGTLGGGSGQRGWTDDLDRAGAFIGYPDPARSLTAPLAGQKYDYETETFAYSVYPESGQGADLVAREVDLAPALTRTGIAEQTDRGTLIARTFRKVHRAQSDEDFETWAEDEVANTLNVHDVGDVYSTNVAVPEQEAGVRRLTPLECTRLQGFPDDWLEVFDADAAQAHARQVLHGLWREVGKEDREGRGSGILASLLSPEVLLAGVYGGWLSWEMAARCAARRGEVSGPHSWSEGFVREMRRVQEHRPTPYRRESFEQLSRELGRPLSELPLEGAQARTFVLDSGVWKEAQEEWPLRHARPAEKSSGKKGSKHVEKGISDSARYKMIGNAVASPCAEWIGHRLMRVAAQVEEDFG